MSVSPVLSFSEQATYDIVNNMGSMAARFIFRPIEDSSYFYFTQTIARDVKLHEQPKVFIRIIYFLATNRFFGRKKWPKPAWYWQIY